MNQSKNKKDQCECGALIVHSRDHPDQCCACFDVSVGMPVAIALREERAEARRKGVIEGMEKALGLFPKPTSTTQWSPQEAIRAEIERLTGGK